MRPENKNEDDIELDWWERTQTPRMIEIKNRTASLIRSYGYQREADSMDKCGVRQGPYAPNRHLCGSTTWCPYCRSFQALRLKRWLILKVSPSAPPSLTWLYITSTAKDCSPRELNLHIQAAITGTERLFKHESIKPLVVGTVSALEWVPANNEPSLTVAHVHSLVGVQRGNILPSKKTWQSLWLALCPGAMGRDIDVQQPPYKKDRDKIIDYITKDSEYDSRSRERDSFIDRWNTILNEPERFITEVRMAYRKKHYFGSLARPRTFDERKAWVAPWN